MLVPSCKEEPHYQLKEPFGNVTASAIDEFEEEENARNDFEESLKVNNIVEQMVNPQPKQIKRGRPKKNK
jgi:hypothetical protein